MSEAKLGCLGMALILAGLAAFQGCRAGQIPDEEAVRVLETQGYSEVQITRRENWWPGVLGGCGENDAVAFEAKAKNPAGRQVDVIVCASWPFKGSTVRVR